MKINKEWHEQHKMPQNPGFEERVKWHLEHLKHCNCRGGDIPKKLLEEMKKRGLELPKKAEDKGFLK